MNQVQYKLLLRNSSRDYLVGKLKVKV